VIEVTLLQTEIGELRYLLQEEENFRDHASHYLNERIARLMEVV
jgi:hypothetical protein